MSERDDPLTIGRRVQRWRAERGLTQKQLAEPAYTPAYISTLEAGRVSPSDEALKHIAERLGVAYDELVTGRSARVATELRLQLTDAQRTLATGDTEASSGRASTKAATSRVRHASKGAGTDFRATSAMRSRAEERCAHASANALWMRGRRCAAACTGAPRFASGTIPFESIAKTGTGAARASAADWAGTTKAGKSSVTTRHARSASRRTTSGLL